MLMPVIVITTGLVLATVFAVESGQRSSRRAGDSASALQVADAAVNAAAQFLPTVPASLTAVGPISASVGNGTYTYSATKIDNLTWNVDALGVDKTGLKRRVLAQAVGTPIFGRPLLVRNTATFSSGAILDSFSGPSTSELCTKGGILSIVNPSALTFGNEGNQANCQGTFLNNGWTAAMDGCEIPSDEEEMALPIPNLADITGSAKCPASNTKRVTPKFPVGNVTAPKQWDFPANSPPAQGDTYTCDATATKALQGGKTYYYKSVLLLGGCVINNAAAGPARLFAETFTFGTKTGAQNQVINAPQPPCAAFVLGGSIPGNTTGYCANWASKLQINVIGAGTVTFKNKARYGWAVINAPSGSVVLETEQLEFWGASVSDSMTASAQFTWHFDDNLLKGLGNGFFNVKNWREEGQ